METGMPPSSTRTEGATVERVSVVAGELHLRFANGRAITASSGPGADGRGWSVGEAGAGEAAARWGMTCERGALFARAPDT
jgi:hypothetical protein